MSCIHCDPCVDLYWFESTINNTYVIRTIRIKIRTVRISSRMKWFGQSGKFSNMLENVPNPPNVPYSSKFPRTIHPVRIKFTEFPRVDLRRRFVEIRLLLDRGCKICMLYELYGGLESMHYVLVHMFQTAIRLIRLLRERYSYGSGGIAYIRWYGTKIHWIFPNRVHI